MKRCMVIILLVCLALCCAGCAQQETVVSQPGNLAVSSVLIFEEKECMEECELSDEVTGVWCAGLSIEPFMQLQLSAQQDGAYQLQMELIADGGHFKSDYEKRGTVETLGTTCTILNGERVYWDYPDLDDDGNIVTSYGRDRSDITVIIRENSHIVGYAVICIQRQEDPDWAYDVPPTKFCPYILESVSFPQVDGEYQDITLEYVCDRIESCVRGNGNNGP